MKTLLQIMLPSAFIFLASLVIFHGLLIWNKAEKQSTIFWKFVDYPWFAAGLFAIVITGMKMYEQNIQNEISIHKEIISWDERSLRQNILYQERACTNSARETENPEKLICNEINKITPVLSTVINENSLVWIKRFAKKIPESNKQKFTVDMYVSALEKQFQIIAAKKKELLSIYSIPCYDEMMLFPLFILPVLLALRITKITGEICIERHKKKSL